MPFSSSNGLVILFSFDADSRGRSPVIEFSCQYPTDPRGRQRIHHRLMGAVDLMDLNLAADIWRPDFMRWLGFALRGHEKQNIAAKLLWQERPHETNAVLVAIDDSLIVMFLEYGMEMSVVTQGVHHRPYRIGHPGEKNLFFVLFMATAQRLLAIARIAVEKGEQCDLLPRGLEVSGNCVSNQAAKRPAKQVVRSGRLNLANKVQIIYGHILNSMGQHFWLREVARL